jgi:hypothetical protein
MRSDLVDRPYFVGLAKENLWIFDSDARGIDLPYRLQQL